MGPLDREGLVVAEVTPWVASAEVPVAALIAIDVPVRDRLAVRTKTVNKNIYTLSITQESPRPRCPPARCMDLTKRWKKKRPLKAPSLSSAQWGQDDRMLRIR